MLDIDGMDGPSDITIGDAQSQLGDGLGLRRVSRAFYEDFATCHEKFVGKIQGINKARDRGWFALVLLNRLIFTYFLQAKGFLDGGRLFYLQDKLNESLERGPDRYYREFLRALFFEGFSKPEASRSETARTLLGGIRYLGGSLFAEHPIEVCHKEICIPDQVFADLFARLQRYHWRLDDVPEEGALVFTPDVLGYVFDMYVNYGAAGIRHTPREISSFLCEETIYSSISDRMGTDGSAGAPKRRGAYPLNDLLSRLDSEQCQELLERILPTFRVLDPACGSGAFLLCALEKVYDLYVAVLARSDTLDPCRAKAWKAALTREATSFEIALKRHIVTHNLFGVDSTKEVVEVARLRLQMALMASARTEHELEPLPNLDYNIMSGNALVGLLANRTGLESRQAREAAFGDGDSSELSQQAARGNQATTDLIQPLPRVTQSADWGNPLGAGEEPLDTQAHRLADKVAQYRDLRDKEPEATKALRAEIEELREKIHRDFDRRLLDEFQALGIRYEEASWDQTTHKPGPPKSRDLAIQDIALLEPFHWGCEFYEVMARGGFDVILGRPPWDVLRPTLQSFSEQMRWPATGETTALGTHRDRKLEDTKVLESWLAYLSRFYLLSAYYGSANQYRHQNPVARGRRDDSRIRGHGVPRRARRDISHYPLFLEQSLNLLRAGGRCGLIMPSGVYSDRGKKHLREMLFDENRLEVLVGISNERCLFEGLHRLYRVCLLSLRKGGKTDAFEAAFPIAPRGSHRAAALGRFLHDGNVFVVLAPELIRRLSPESWAIPEFHGEMDVHLAKKFGSHPPVGGYDFGVRGFSLMSGIQIVSNRRPVPEAPPSGHLPLLDGLPLYEGRTIHQFDHQYGRMRYWIDAEGVRLVRPLKSPNNTRHPENWQYRLALRAYARENDERTLIAAILPPGAIADHTLLVSTPMEGTDLLFLEALLNSFALDYLFRIYSGVRVRGSSICSLPLPRLTDADPRFLSIVRRAARLTCTTPEFDALAKEAGLQDHREGVLEPVGRARLRSELDGLVAHLYGLNEQEFAHILNTFPRVPNPARVSAQNAWRDINRGKLS